MARPERTNSIAIVRISPCKGSEFLLEILL